MKNFFSCLFALCFLSLSAEAQFIRGMRMPVQVILEEVVLTGKNVTPYYFTEWLPGSVTDSKGKKTGDYALRFNCFTGRAEYKEGEAVFEIPDGSVSAFEIQTAALGAGTAVIFSKGFPAVGNHDKKTFYRIYREGKVSVLTFIKKKEIRKQEIYIGEEKDGYRTVTENYLLIDGKMYLVNNKKQLIKSLPADLAKKVSDYADSRKLKLKEIEDILEVAEFLDPAE